MAFRVGRAVRRTLQQRFVHGELGNDLVNLHAKFLLNHLRQEHTEENIHTPFQLIGGQMPPFVQLTQHPVNRTHAFSPKQLSLKVQEASKAEVERQREALDQRRGANILSGLAVAALEASCMKTAAEALLRGAGGRAAKQAGLVIWLDEAQTVDESCKALASVHKGALGVPAVVVLSGLPTTVRCVRSIPGLCRLADAAVIDMGAMSADECAVSTRMML